MLTRLMEVALVCDGVAIKNPEASAPGSLKVKPSTDPVHPVVTTTTVRTPCATVIAIAAAEFGVNGFTATLPRKRVLSKSYMTLRGRQLSPSPASPRGPCISSGTPLPLPHRDTPFRP